MVIKRPFILSDSFPIRVQEMTGLFVLVLIPLSKYWSLCNFFKSIEFLASKLTINDTEWLEMSRQLFLFLSGSFGLGLLGWFLQCKVSQINSQLIMEELTHLLLEKQKKMNIIIVFELHKYRLKRAAKCSIKSKVKVIYTKYSKD